MTKPQILLTNDDGILSPGLWAAAESLSALGFVHVVAPREQSTGMGRSMPNTSDGVIVPQEVTVGGKTWTVYAVGGTPAQAVQHGLLEVLPIRPALVVSGINYGENLGTGITISGTVGAAMEAAAMGIPGLAVSLETESVHHLSYSTEVDFSGAAYFTAFFAQWMLENTMPFDVDLLKVDVPASATRATEWAVTHLARKRYFEPTAPLRTTWNEPGRPGYRRSDELAQFDRDSDVYAVLSRRVVSVTPVSLDMTARIPLETLRGTLARSLSAQNR
ncbi:MAG: 5'/3'-nucleotidase SurE [Anaerolineales bacterium]|nr:5'/3'-nucleotidase SurE [Anaerolineales bacterium]